MNEGALLRQIEDAEPSASPCTLEWGSRYGGLVTIALLDGKAVAGISGPWSGKFALTWWDRPLPARRLDLFDSVEDAQHAVETWAQRMCHGAPAPRAAARAAAAPHREPAASVFSRMRSLFPEFARPAAPSGEAIDRLRRLRVCTDPDLSGLHFAAHD